MMRVNLLPVRAARRQVSARQELLILAGVLAIVAAGLFAWATVSAAKVGDMRDRLESVGREMETVKKDVARVQEFKTKADLYERKLKVIEELERKKIGPARMLDDLATVLTEQHGKIWLTKVDEKDGTLTLEGAAMEEENISDFQMGLAKRSKIFSEVKLGLVAAQKKGNVPLLEWKITCKTNYAAG